MYIPTLFWPIRRLVPNKSPCEPLNALNSYPRAAVLPYTAYYRIQDKKAKYIRKDLEELVNRFFFHSFCLFIIENVKYNSI